MNIKYTTDEERFQELVVTCQNWKEICDRLLDRLNAVNKQFDAVILALRQAKYCDYQTRDERHIWHDGMCLVCETSQREEEA